MAHAGEMPSETRLNIGEPRDMMLDNALDDVAFPFQTVNSKLSPATPIGLLWHVTLTPVMWLMSSKKSSFHSG
ncbi:hypothetical protein [Thalassolituus sp.]|uniref:hypothetical protein n=1 Tax=Thalassolituus sp. TaxID=2030822 RepID=UPI003512EEC6